MKNYKLWRGVAAALCLLFSLLIFFTVLAFEREGDVNLFLNTRPPSTEVTEGTNYFPSEYKSKDEMLAAQKEHVITVQEEGSVLLKNDANTLPLMDNERNVTLFGYTAADQIFHGGSGGPMDTGALDLYSALKAQGFKINDTVYNALKNQNLGHHKGAVSEVPVSLYTPLQGSYASAFNDAAIIVLGRFGGEEKELDHTGDTPQLALQQNEKDLLNMVKNSGKFKKTIVIVNSGYAMDLGWLNEYGVDACLWIGYTGHAGMEGVANVLSGKADPSGRLADTHAENSLSSPAMQNFGDFTFSNLSTMYKNKYLVYAEGIYSGYKYYETRYQDCVLGINGATGSYGKFASKGAEWNYADEMAYTFGSGISYAGFSQTLTELDWDRTAHKVTATVKVKNNGDETYKGKSKCAVQLYVQLPYESGMAEKSAIQIADFEKSAELAAGEEADVKFEFSDYIFATYDEKVENGAAATKKGCYVFDKGDYYFSIGDNAHDALNNVLAARGANGLYDADGLAVTGNTAKTKKFTVDATDNSTYAKSQRTGEVVSNLFADRDLNYFYDTKKVTYLTRSDWSTFPQTVATLTATDEIKHLMEDSLYVKPSDAPAVSSFTHSADNNLKLVQMRDVKYDDDEKWTLFIDQLAPGELAQIVGDKMSMDAIKSVGMPAYSGGDGPDGYQAGGVLYNAEVVATSTFDKKLIVERGKFFGEDALWLGNIMIYGPGGNLHRSPYSGRNFEYYSEDSIMSYICGEYQTSAMSTKGLIATIKHYPANDQETNRHGVATFMTEQTYREGALRGFEGALAEGGALGTMTSYNRVGCLPSACDYETQTQVLRNEWGFKGINMTDSSKDSASYMSTADSIFAGTTQFNNDPGRVAEMKNLLIKEQDGFIWGKTRELAKNFFYALSRSKLINGLSPDTVITDFIPWWKPAMISLNVVVGLVMLGSASMFVVFCYFKKSKKEGNGNG